MSNPSIVLITGGSSGLGKATGRYLTEKGFRVYGTARNPQKYPDFDAFPLLEMEVRNQQSVERAVAELISLEGRIDILINNAGVGITGPMEETPHQQSLDALETNFHGPLRVMAAVVPHMRRQGNGFIINISSIAGYMGLPFRGMYSASKGALLVASEAYRMELSQFGIRVCTLSPGDYATNIASGRYHHPAHGDSPYAASYGKSLELMNTHVKSGGNPEEVAHKIYRILKKKKPRVHYTVGSPLQRLSLFLKRILPDKIYERLLLNHYKL